MTPPRLVSSLIAAPHGFFGRDGGVSTGLFRSLNTGLGSTDAPSNAQENRERCRRALGAHSLVTLFQAHTADVVIVEAPWTGQGPRADAMATKVGGIALGVLAADCMPFLFHDEEADVIGAAHAGWRGALAGVLEAAIGAMARIGARPERIRAALGPCLRQDSFEVGLDLFGAFCAKHPPAERFFAPGVSSDKRQFDLAGFGRWRLSEAGVESLDDMQACTLSDHQRWFSYRASRRAGDNDYGRNLSAIALPATGT